MFDDFDITMQSDEFSGYIDYEEYVDDVDYIENDELYYNYFDKSYYDYRNGRIPPYRGLDV